MKKVYVIRGYQVDKVNDGSVINDHMVCELESEDEYHIGCLVYDLLKLNDCYQVNVLCKNVGDFIDDECV